MNGSDICVSGPRLGKREKAASVWKRSVIYSKVTIVQSLNHSEPYFPICELETLMFTVVIWREGR